jgi:hypothetical protein
MILSRRTALLSRSREHSGMDARERFAANLLEPAQARRSGQRLDGRPEHSRKAA